MEVRVTKVLVRLVGITPIMFDRYAGSNKEQLPWRDKVYLSSADKKTLVLPARNISSFLSAQNTVSAPRRVMDKWKAVAAAALSYVATLPVEIPFTRKGKTLITDNAGLFEDVSWGRLPKAIPHEVHRPILPLDWELEFTISLFDNPDLTNNILRKLFDVGGLAIGLGTYRGVYGKFVVDKWEDAS